MRLIIVVSLMAGLAFAADDRELAREIAIGKSAAANIHTNYALLPDEWIQSEVVRIGQRIAAQLACHELPFVFKVVVGESSPPWEEPWAFPGGFVYIPSALILRAQSEAQLAGMIAHSMTHIAQRHMKQVNKKAGLPAYIVWSPTGPHSTLLAALWRPYEFAADADAARLMARAGYDPAELVDYLERGGVDAERVAKLIKAASDELPAGVSVPGYEFTNLQAEVRKFAYLGDAPKSPSLRYSGRR